MDTPTMLYVRNYIANNTKLHRHTHGHPHYVGCTYIANNTKLYKWPPTLGCMYLRTLPTTHRNRHCHLHYSVCTQVHCQQHKATVDMANHTILNVQSLPTTQSYRNGQPHYAVCTYIANNRHVQPHYSICMLITNNTKLQTWPPTLFCMFLHCQLHKAIHMATHTMLDVRTLSKTKSYKLGYYSLLYVRT